MFKCMSVLLSPAELLKNIMGSFLEFSNKTVNLVLKFFSAFPIKPDVIIRVLFPDLY